MTDGLLSGETCPNFSVGSHRYALRKKLTNDYPSALLKSLWFHFNAMTALKKTDTFQKERRGSSYSLSLLKSQLTYKAKPTPRLHVAPSSSPSWLHIIEWGNDRYRLHGHLL